MILRRRQTGAVEAQGSNRSLSDYASGWLNLGVMYRVTDQVDLAKRRTKAIEIPIIAPV